MLRPMPAACHGGLLWWPHEDLISKRLDRLHGAGRQELHDVRYGRWLHILERRRAHGRARSFHVAKLRQEPRSRYLFRLGGPHEIHRQSDARGRYRRAADLRQTSFAALEPRQVTLLGDATHPVVPTLGQGANMTFEDAYEIAECLSGSPDIETAFQG